MGTSVMAALFYILTLLTLVAHGCPPPFNDFKYANNDTLLREKINEYKSDPQLGWAHAVGGASSLRPWPANAQGIVFIPYCFEDAWAKKKIEKKFHDAWERWSNKIGDPKVQTGHRLGGFQEIKNGNGQSMFCYRDEAKEFWNPQVPGDTLKVTVRAGTGASFSTMGYKPSTWTNIVDRHSLNIGWHNNPAIIYDQDVYTLAHEMGHVFGLQHEHQRPDRDSYVKFECSNLKGYADAVLDLQQNPTLQGTIQDLCTSPFHTRLSFWADKGFKAYDFSIIPAFDLNHVDENGDPDGQGHPYDLTTSRAYDINSIMHYQSDGFARSDVVSGRTPLTVHNAVLVVWKDGGPGYQPPIQATPQNARLKELEEKDYKRWPSDGDFEGIKAIYPW